MIRMFDRSRRARLVLVVLLLASLAIVSIGFRAQGGSPFDGLGRVAMTVLGPVQEGLAAVFRPVGNFFAGFTQVPSLKERVARLERQNASLQLQQNQITDLTRENASLRKLLQMRERLDLATVAAQVTGVSPTNFGRTVFINKGSRDGVTRDMPVIGADGLVGRVTNVARAQSVVLLLVDRSSRVAARLASSGEQGMLEGLGTADLRLRLLDPEAAVAVGDRVLTSGYDRGLFPPGIPIGTVIEAPKAGSALTRDVTVRPLVDFSRLDHVLLVTGQRRPAR